MSDSEINERPLRDEEGENGEPPRKRQKAKKKKAKAVKSQVSDDVRLIYEMFKEHAQHIETKLNTLEADVKKTAQAQKTLVAKKKGRGSKEATPESHSSGFGDKNIVYSITNLNQERPKFGGLNSKDRHGKGIHPVTFLEDLNSYLKKIPSQGKELDIIQECLTDQARNWARIYRDRWSTYDDFKQDFLNTFWSEVEQNKVRRNIVSNTWNRKENPTMLGHFLSLAGQVGLLKLTIPERQLVADIMRHYPKEVQQLWALSRNETILAATEFLRQMDNIETIDESSPRASTNFAPPRESQFEKRKQHNKQYGNYPNWRKPEDLRQKRESGGGGVSKAPDTSASAALVEVEEDPIANDNNKGNL